MDRFLGEKMIFYLVCQKFRHNLLFTKSTKFRVKNFFMPVGRLSSLYYICLPNIKIAINDWIVRTSTHGQPIEKHVAI